MRSRKEQIYQFLSLHVSGLTANEIASQMELERSNVSRYLTELYKEKRVFKSSGRPVVYSVNVAKQEPEKYTVSFDDLVGSSDSLKISIQQAKAAILYPPRGLHTIIFGETGTGKSLFAECMYQFAISSQTLSEEAPFISFNCADYAQNPQLLFSHIFGVKKGAYTGADSDRPGLLSQADGGILFLDEIHRLPPEGQEMLFTFIDKGEFRPLGESTEVHHASVQIIGATTESSEVFLTTFNRRIPMSITLPALRDRSLDERYEIVTLFIKQEADRLNQKIVIERDVLLGFMLYDAEGNIGQVKRDLKLVCAKAFLHYRTHGEAYLTIKQNDLPLNVQKGLLRVKDLPDHFERAIDKNKQHLTFEPGAKEVVWQQDPARDMGVYQTIEDRVSDLKHQEIEEIDLEKLIEADVNQFFEAYMDELASSTIHRDLIPDNIWNLTNRLYDIAEEKLDRVYNEKARFAFALHLQGTLERIREKRLIVHPSLNDVRINYREEFQVALDLSAMIEHELALQIPFDEIGFITMFLSVDLTEAAKTQTNDVQVILLMHGQSTASSMLEAVQELLGTKTGVAFNMPLTMEVQTMYEQVKDYVLNHKEEMRSGMLLLTDMGSLNTFGNMIYEETGVKTRAISMVSTMIVLEAVRMVSTGRSLEDIYQNIQVSFQSIVRNQFKPAKELPKAIVVTCFTGEGVAAKLSERIKPILNEEIEVFQLQYLEKESFRSRIDELLENYDIKGIVGTVDVEYQNIPFFSAFDIFNNHGLTDLKRIAADEVEIDQMIYSLKGSLTHVDSVSDLLHLLQSIVEHIQRDLKIILEPGIESAIMIHIAFLIDGLKSEERLRVFKDLEHYKTQHRIEFNGVKTKMMQLEKRYEIAISEDEIAYITEMFLDNAL
ncbi:sigma 54-interacting transcriptional regulator [Vagococcus zengguangii]|uniref:sigma 54-interacting transcriptional regulator n=1 Tax=Vagococcus zengguangii TaxID=2571750 RepID=UPI001108A999|nr:sigma-54-dependent transcriptional regulator [Vagococcus zengguangii]TLG80889.1 PRD domain-containing protein [Vagococcus zengguangii]